MSKLKKVLLMVTVWAAVAALAITGTVAYLKDEDGDVNVMTMGNVTIDQLEYERVVDVDGNWVSAGETDKYGYTPDKVKEYTQAKPLYPAVFADGDIKWDDRAGGTHQQSWAEVGASGSNQLFDDSVKNAQDKFVFVKNTGKSDAYVRTWFAFEQGAVAAEDFDSIIRTNGNATHWSWETVATDVEIGEGTYVLFLATYLGPKSNPTGILAPGAVSYPSLLQVYMSPEATNEDIAAIDGNNNGTYDILVFSQAIQAAGFEAPATTFSLRAPATAAEIALTEGFGTAHPWADGVDIPNVVTEANDAYDSSLKSGLVILGNDIKTSEADKHYSKNREYAITGGREYTLDLNGHTIEHDCVYQDGNNTGYTYLFTTAYNGKLTIDGEGAIYSENKDGNVCIIYAQGPSEVVINSGDFETVKGVPVWAGNNSKVTINGGSFISTGSNEELIYSSGGVIDIYGGFFHNTGWENRPVNVANRNRGTGFINIYGGTFVNFDPSTGGDDPNNILVADGYKVVAEPQANGDVWYTVVAK